MKIKIELKLSRFIWLFDSLLKVLLALEDVAVYTQPVFEDPSNVTAIAGNNAKLQCKVHHLENYTVAWVNPRGTILTRGYLKITDDTRISTDRNVDEDWNIIIRNISFEDRGFYNCVINTAPFPSVNRVHLHVIVPPRIIGRVVHAPVVVREGETVTLVCNATGYPLPKIHWFRDRITNVTDLPGDTLVIRNITRHCAGEYQCRANNGLSREDTRVFKVEVHFAPEVSMLIPRLGITLGSETVLQCSCSSSPIGVCVWKKDGRDLRISGKYELNPYNEGHETITLGLTISHIQEEDLGRYECHAQNELGQDSGYTDLYEYRPPVPPTHAPTARPTPRLITPDSGYRPVPTKTQKNIFDDEHFVFFRPSTIKTPASKYSSESRSSSLGVAFCTLVIGFIGLHFFTSLSL
eukprot:XP_011447500.1 PREDICTED: neuronal growth regulator 1 isoform X3 [Crassostrea gigas]